LVRMYSKPTQQAGCRRLRVRKTRLCRKTSICLVTIDLPARIVCTDMHTKEAWQDVAPSTYGPTMGTRGRPLPSTGSHGPTEARPARDPRRHPLDPADRRPVARSSRGTRPLGHRLGSLRYLE